MQDVTGSACVRVQKYGGSRTEMDLTQEKTWAAFQIRRQMWLARRSQVANVHMLHISVQPVIVWSAECRFWAKKEVNVLRTFQLCMTRRVLQLWPREAEAWNAYLVRSTQELIAFGTRQAFHIGKQQQRPHRVAMGRTRSENESRGSSMDSRTARMARGRPPLDPGGEQEGAAWAEATAMAASDGGTRRCKNS